ncbi:hypothetical protein APUTEX25_003788, partial [Auxenochlorella protothecoides]
MSRRETTSGLADLLETYRDASTQDRVLWLSCAAAGVCVAGTAFWWLTRESYYSYVPLQYQYRPGTFTGWVSRLLDKHAKRRRSRRPIRVYMDGCFDLMHYGHANALRQAKACLWANPVDFGRSLGDQLVLGLIPDSEIRRCKGPPILNEEERRKLVESVKWVDEVITDVPYDLTPAFLDELITKHKIDYVIHGDDPCLLPDGTDAYEHAKKLGRFLMIKRTEGVSTTDIVGRMLICSRVNALNESDEKQASCRRGMLLTREFSRGRDKGNFRLEDIDEDSAAGSADSPKERNVTVSRFMPTSRRIVQFSSGRSPPPGAKVVYIDGSFDLFHVGHVDILKAARSKGDFLLVGIHTDEDVAERRGPHQPIMNLHERALSVLACKYADEVIIGAPQTVTEDLLTTFGIGEVVRGSVHESGDASSERGRYEVPIAHGTFRRLASPSPVTSATVIRRIVDNRAQYEARNAKKGASEASYYAASKQYVH